MIAATGNICTNETAQDDRKPTAEDTYNIIGQQAQKTPTSL